MNRAIDIFFYGLFMDRQALIGQGIHPGPDSVASVDGFRLHIGDRATLVPLAGETAWGVAMALPSDEVAQLYGAPSVADYRPEAALARKKDGETGCGALLKPDDGPAFRREQGLCRSATCTRHRAWTTKSLSCFS